MINKLKNTFFKVFDKKPIGHIDTVTDELITGWVFHQAKPNLEVTFNLFFNDEWMAEIQANHFREDLKKQKMGNGLHGFSFDIPPQIELPETAEIKLITSANEKIDLLPSSKSKFVLANTFRKKINEDELPQEVIQIVASKIFSLPFYNTQFPQKFLNIYTAALHYWQVGANENKIPHFLFDANLYLQNSPDVQSDAINPLYHYISSGWKENRNPSSQFNAQLYQAQYAPQLIENPLSHYIKTFLNPENLKDTDPNIELYFDDAYYLKENPDVVASGINPQVHYFNFGYKEARNPNPYFNTSFYKQNNADVSQSGINPFLHYLLYGKKEGRKIKKFVDVDLLKQTLNINNVSSKTQLEVDIILPVYNGYDFVKDLLPNLLKNTTIPFNLFIINDASPDKKIDGLLKSELKKFKSAKLITNEKNLGFVKSVNIGLDLAKNDVVILNSDTVLPKGWLQRLMYPVWTNKQIASVTPFTNAGTIASYPLTLQDNDIFLNLNIDEIDEVFSGLNPEVYTSCPTGVGFCMSMSKKALKKIGGFDDKTFEKGYGEENDWCRRAAKAGFLNVITPNLFVWHKHGGSFTSSEKQKLIATNTKKLVEKHPEYFSEVRKHISLDSLDSVRLYATIWHMQKKSKNSPALYIDHQIGGGANVYLKKIIAAERAVRPVMLFTYNFKLHCNQLSVYYGDFEIERYFDTTDNIFEFIGLFPLHQIFYNNLVSFKNLPTTLNQIEFLQQKTKAKIVVAIHDFFPVCQSFTLLNNHGVYCGAETNPNVCKQCIKSNIYYEDSSISITQWRQNWEQILALSTSIICFSESSKKIIKKVYGHNPKIKKALTVKPHTLPEEIPFKPQLPLTTSLNIGIVGTINHHKGHKVIQQLAKYLLDHNLGKITIIGKLSPYNINYPNVHQTGAYTPKMLPKMVENEKITVFLFPSVWPETFSFVTDEIIEMDVPVVCFNIGAPAERIADYPKGKIIPLSATNQEIAEELIQQHEYYLKQRIHLIKQKFNNSGLFDEKFYLDQYPDVAKAGADPHVHFFNYGGFENRNPSLQFNTKYYLQSNPDVKNLGVNPLVHYIEYGKAEGRLPTEPKGYNLFQQNLKLNTNQKIAVLVHGYYHDLIEELLNATLTIPLPYTILISVIDAKGEQEVKNWQQKHPNNKVICRLVENRGRDIAPAFISFAAELKQFDLVCKIHTKKSLYTGAEQVTWRKQLVNNLLGSKNAVENIIHLFQQNAKLGIVYPYSKLLPYWAYTWLSNQNIAFGLQNKLNIPLQTSGYIDYPMGSMFWFRPHALRQLHSNILSISDFKEEPCGNDGTFAHAIERAFVDIVKHNGYSYAELNFEDNSFALNFGTKNFYQYTEKSEEELKAKINEYAIISFDIFDTLLTRKVFNPDEVMHMVEATLNQEFNTETHFFDWRKKAENESRKLLKKDVSYSEIYLTLTQISNLEPSVVQRAQQLEFELEKQMLIPRQSMVNAFNYCLAQKKQVWLTTDMYLEPEQLEEILTLNQITGYHQLWVSNALNGRKDNGKMWDFLLENHIKNKSEFLHIGDNEHADIQQTVDRGLGYYHLLSGSNLFKNTAIGLQYKSIFPQWQKHQFLGLINSRLFNSPFVNPNQNSLSPAAFNSPQTTGYIAFGPVVFSYLIWMVQQAKKQGIKHLYFLAREGYFLKQCYDVLVKQPQFKQLIGQPLQSTYLLISRRAAMGAVTKTETILHDILTNNSFEGTLHDFLYHRLGVEINAQKHPEITQKIRLPQQHKEVAKTLQNFMPEINNQTEKEQKSIKNYLKSINFFSPNKVGLVDVGYSGTIQKFLFDITQQKMHGYYFVTKNVTQNFTHANNFTEGYFENNAESKSETPILKFNLYLEFWLTSNQGQLLNFESTKSESIPNFKALEPAKKYFEINEKITQGCLNFIEDACSLVSNNFEGLGLNPQTAQYFFELAVRKDLWDEQTRKIAFLEDDFCGNLENLNVIEDYKKYVL